MSARRAANANLPAWLSLLFFIPILQYLLIFTLCLLPTSSKYYWTKRHPSSFTQALPSLIFLPIILMITLFVILGILLVWLSANVFQTYASALFLGYPFMVGFLSGYLLMRKGYFPRLGYIKSFAIVILVITLVHALLILFALEGLICVIMILPFAIAISLAGTVFGVLLASYSKPTSISPTFLFLFLPVLPWLESQGIKQKIIQSHQGVVLSKIEIQRTPEQVWPHVVSFSDIPPPRDWLFQLGIAYPIRAHIEGQGVGAVRYCEFSTGPFVEPITVWDAPHRLAFSVKEQPHSMQEISFYDNLNPPHVEGYFRSIKGEFRLIPSGNKTILEGRTWYEMDIFPGWYWQIYAQWFVHKIHMRVLKNIQKLSESI